MTNSNTTLYINDPASGLRVEKVTGATGSVQWNDYLFAGGRMVAQHYNMTIGGVTTTSTSYFTLDHLGSIAVIADGSGAVIERLSYDAWGKRRFPTGADDPTGSITSSTTRGFTGHEMIDDVGLVNMNGRIYDPQIGRFLSADPIVQDLTDSQALNRYSYVRNNPLSLTDPDGFSWFSNIIKAVVAIVAVVLLQYYILPALWGTTYAALTTPTLTGAAAATASTTLAINAGIAGAIGGYIATGTIKGAIVGGLTAVAFYQVGNVIQDNKIGTLGAAGLHGAVGCASSVAGGGSCQSGFLAAGFSSVAGSFGDVAANDNFGDLVANTAQHAVVGGFGSILGGGKFGNGAVTGAFGYLFNCSLHPGTCTKADESAIKEKINNCDGSFKCYREAHLDRKEAGLLQGASMDDVLSDFMRLSIEGAASISGGAVYVEKYGVKQFLDTTFRVINFFSPFGAEPNPPIPLPKPTIVRPLPRADTPAPAPIPGRPPMTQEPLP